jgi:nucleotide-binding universal stress UspA family protein
MDPIRRILVAVDFSPHSRVALDYAATLADAFGATVEVLHVWEPPLMEPPGPIVAEAQVTLWEMLQRNAETALAEFVAQASERGVRVSSSRALVGSPARAILDEAERSGANLIVVGSHGRTGLSRALLGSVAERVVRHAHCPVLCVRSPLSKPS